MADEDSRPETAPFWSFWTIIWLGMGVAIGSIFGTSLDNMPMGIVMGLAIGMILAIAFRSRRKG